MHGMRTEYVVTGFNGIQRDSTRFNGIQRDSTGFNGICIEYDIV